LYNTDKIIFKELFPKACIIFQDILFTIKIISKEEYGSLLMNCGMILNNKLRGDMQKNILTEYKF